VFIISLLYAPANTTRRRRSFRDSTLAYSGHRVKAAFTRFVKTLFKCRFSRYRLKRRDVCLTLAYQRVNHRQTRCAGHDVKDKEDTDADANPRPLLPPIGAKFYHAGSAQRLYHVRAHVDGAYVVMRTWSARKGWRYVVEHVYVFGFDSPLYTKTKEKRGMR